MRRHGTRFGLFTPFRQLIHRIAILLNDSLGERRRVSVSSSQQHTLATLQQTLSESIAVAKQHRDASVGTRKELVDGTKQLQKHLKTVVGDADTTSLAKTVIQQYRDAMDQLTKRCKQAEASVVAAQTLLIELEPDITQQQQQVQQLLTAR